MTSSSLRSGNISDDYQEESGVLETCTIEDRLNEALDDLFAKSSKTRLVAYETIRKALSEHYMEDYVFNNKITILGALSRCIGKRTQGQDLGLAANLIALVCATLGPHPETDAIFADLITQLVNHLIDPTIQPDVRSKCARSIGVCSFVVSVDGHYEHIMNALKSIFVASCAKGDGSMPNPTESLASLHTACLQSWTLLLTFIHNCRPDVAIDLTEEFMEKVAELLDSPHLELKLAAGETLAIMFDILKINCVDCDPAEIEDICDKIREMVMDSQKSKGKRDLRQQRSIFREILLFIEDEVTPNLTIKFKSERLVLNSWFRRRQYDAFTELFATGSNAHLADNELIRDIFELGPVISPIDKPRMKRSDNSYENSMVDKMRTKNMRKLRDKRAKLFD